MLFIFGLLALIVGCMWLAIQAIVPYFIHFSDPDAHKYHPDVEELIAASHERPKELR